jgi:protoporphyrinogen oxidase
MSRMPRIIILGSGMAGLAAGYYAKKKGFPFLIYEGKERTGGNTITFQHGDCRFDSGAHRFHDKDFHRTEELKAFLGEDLVRTDAPSQIYHNSRLFNFPLTPLNLLVNLGVFNCLKAAGDILRSKLIFSENIKTFEQFALRKYGKDIAARFLLNYSEKLWGIPCNKLSIKIAGERLQGLDLKTFIEEAVLGRKAKSRHIDGTSFYYPKRGIGTIPQKIAQFCGKGNIFTKSKITKVFHNTNAIQALEINGRDKINVRTDKVICALPLNYVLEIMEPSPPKEIILASGHLRYRNLILVAFFLKKASVNKNATVYFPDESFPFTRIYEPRNRDMGMSPHGRTSLVAEIPCQEMDKYWLTEDEGLIDIILPYLVSIGWIKEEDILDATVRRLKYAYPILETGYEEKVREIDNHFSGFKNIEFSGRNGRFMYSWIHNMMRMGKNIIDKIDKEYQTKKERAKSKTH